jgi:hypothetical protein
MQGMLMFLPLYIYGSSSWPSCHCVLVIEALMRIIEALIRIIEALLRITEALLRITEALLRIIDNY